MARGGAPGGFDVNALMKQAQKMQSEMLQAQLYEEIGRLKVELDWLKRKVHLAS